MRRAELHYDLPPELIAAQPVEPRDASRLLVLERADGAIRHCQFRDLGDFLRPRDCLVLNNTRVLAARFYCQRATGGRVEALFLRTESEPFAADPQRPAWRVLLKSSPRLREDEQLVVLDSEGRVASPQTIFTLGKRLARGEWRVHPVPDTAPFELLARVGHTPLPPYILRARQHADASVDRELSAVDRERYQTVYAEAPGAVAAPTAGLHFTPELLNQLDAAGVRRVTVTLHVGPGTFQPIDVDDLRQHRMHAEHYEVSAAALAAIADARASGGRIVAVGTTSARVLETLAAPDAALKGQTEIFIYPPYAYRHVDALLTNFHLPESTLLALVMAFASPAQIQAAYAAAIAERYRFFSYGDAMLIL